MLKNKKNIIVIVLLFSIVILLSIITVLVIELNRKNENINDQNGIRPVVTTTPQLNQNDLVLSSERILYIDQGNVWVINLDLSDKRKLTTDGTLEGDNPVSYTSVAWVEQDLASYVRCSIACSVYTYRLSTNEVEKVFDYSDNFTILALNWSQNSTNNIASFIAVSKEQSIDTNKVAFFSEPTGVQTLYSYKPTLGRGAGFLDVMDTKFSSNGRFVLAENSFNSGESEKIIIFDLSENKIVGRLGNDYIGSVFGGDTEIFTYKGGNTRSGIYRFSFLTQTTPVLFANEQFVPWDIFGGKLTGNFVGETSSGVLAEMDIATKEILFPGEILVRPSYANSTKSFVGNLIKEYELGSYAEGVYVYTPSTIEFLKVSDTAQSFRIEK